MTSSLIPEKPILIYPSLAATVGLEEATLLSMLVELAERVPGSSSNGYTWFTVDSETVARAMPFWEPRDVQRISKNLRDQGIVLIASAPFETSGKLKYAFNERADAGQSAPAQTPPTPTTAATTPGSKNYIAPNWQPNREVLAQLAQHNITEAFAREQVPEFVTYWRERGDTQRSWGSKFIKHVIHKWRNYETFQIQRDQESPMHRHWRPSEDAMDVLTKHAGISRDFIEDAIPEFILYWQERGEALRTWNSKFIQHVRRQWLRYNAALEQDTEPRPLPADWQPSEDVFDVLRLANIDIAFARRILPEFALYWRDSGQPQVSWNTRFLQYVKKQWAKRHAMADTLGGRQSAEHVAKSTRDITLEEQLTDRSWAQS